MNKWKFILNQDGLIIKLTLLVYILVVTFCFFTSEKQPNEFNFHNLDNFESEWVIDGQSSSLPLHYTDKKDVTISLQNKLPSKIKDDNIFCYPSNFCRSRVYIDGEERFSYGETRQLQFGRMVGYRICIIPVYPEDSGKDVVIELIPSYSHSVDIPYIYHGTRAQLLYFIVHKEAWKIAACAIFAIFVIISLIMAYKQERIRGRNDKVGMLKSYALFTFSGIVWLISSSELPQLFTDSSEAVTLLSYLSLAFISVPYAFFCREVFKTGKDNFKRLYCLGCFITLLIIILFSFNIADPYETLWLSHAYLFIMMICNIYYIFKERKINPLAVQFRHATALLGIFSVIGFELYYRKPTSGYDAVAFGIGFMLFSGSLFSITVTENENMLQEIVRLDIYKSLAYKDGMTKLGNRAAFDNALKFIVENSNSQDNVVLIIFDLNNLKKVNDGIGHQAGDEMIKGIAQCISDAFQSAGNSYRIGGDEFATILIGSHFDVDSYFDTLDKRIGDYNATHTYPITTAKGYVIEQINNINENNIADFIQRADEEMYKNKKFIKAKNN